MSHQPQPSAEHPSGFPPQKRVRISSERDGADATPEGRNSRTAIETQRVALPEGFSACAVPSTPDVMAEEAYTTHVRQPAPSPRIDPHQQLQRHPAAASPLAAAHKNLPPFSQRMAASSTSDPSLLLGSGAPFVPPHSFCTTPTKSKAVAGSSLERRRGGTTRSISPHKSSTQPKSVTAGPSSPAARTRDGRIKVVVRKRPFMPGEVGSDCVVVSSPQLFLEMTKQRVDLSEYTERSEYCFDDVFDTTDRNQYVYTSCALELLDVALAGGSASCFAFGQTGSGKTHTMMGTESEKGLYLLAAIDIFRRITPGQRLDVSFYEIYCNSLFDLLNDRCPIILREGGDRRVNLCGLSWHPMSSAEELWRTISVGMDQRRIGSTSANEQSSRSHAILSIRITTSTTATSEGSQGGIINFVDLAGSERAADTANNDKQTRLEGAEINKSLLALKECIRALDERKKHVPFRGSRLTEVLRDSFTGNSKTVMIVNIPPNSINFEQTVNTLRYAFRVKGLSVASVAPSKARNAPRPYAPPRAQSRPIERPTDRTAAVTPRHSASTTKIADRRHVHSASPTPARDSGGERLTRKQQSPSPGRNVAEGDSRGTVSDSSFQQWKPLTLSPGIPPVSSHHHSDPSHGSRLSGDEYFSLAAQEEMEQRIRQSVMRQLQKDLSTEIQQVLDDRDATISRLRRENAELRQTISELQSSSGGSRSSIYPLVYQTTHRDTPPKPSEAFVVRKSYTPLESDLNDL